MANDNPQAGNQPVLSIQQLAQMQSPSEAQLAQLLASAPSVAQQGPIPPAQQAPIQLQSQQPQMDPRYVAPTPLAQMQYDMAQKIYNAQPPEMPRPYQTKEEREDALVRASGHQALANQYAAKAAKPTLVQNPIENYGLKFILGKLAGVGTVANMMKQQSARNNAGYQSEAKQAEEAYKYAQDLNEGDIKMYEAKAKWDAEHQGHMVGAMNPLGQTDRWYGSGPGTGSGQGVALAAENQKGAQAYKLNEQGDIEADKEPFASQYYKGKADLTTNQAAGQALKNKEIAPDAQSKRGLQGAETGFYTANSGAKTTSSNAYKQSVEQNDAKNRGNYELGIQSHITAVEKLRQQVFDGIAVAGDQMSPADKATAMKHIDQLDSQIDDLKGMLKKPSKDVASSSNAGINAQTTKHTNTLAAAPEPKPPTQAQLDELTTAIKGGTATLEQKNLAQQLLKYKNKKAQ